MHKKESPRSRIVVLHHVLLCFSFSVTEPFIIAKVLDRNKVAMLRGNKDKLQGHSTIQFGEYLFRRLFKSPKIFDFSKVETKNLAALEN